MQTYKFKYEKLVRDLIPEKIELSGGLLSQRILSGPEYVEALKNKLLEESAELGKAESKEEILNELADIQEVIDNLLASLELNSDDLKKVQAIKNDKNGSFRDKIYINYITVDESFDWLDYHLNNQDKYPLIK